MLNAACDTEVRMGALDDGERVSAADAAAWREWLQTHHASATGVWLLNVRGAASDGIGYEDAVRQALCFGWIDGPVRTSLRAMHFRSANRNDGHVLLDALYEAFNWKGIEEFSRQQMLETPEIGRYVEGWQRATDFGIVATEQDGTPVGAAWCRLFDESDPGYGFVDSKVPELTIAVFAGNRGQGIGGQLLRNIVGEARERGYPAVSLSVEDGNRARRLYESLGFRPTGRNGGSDTMTVSFEADEST